MAMMSPGRAGKHFSCVPVLFLVAACVLFCRPGRADAALPSETGLGVYGVQRTGLEQAVHTLRKAHVGDAFAPPHRETIARLKQEGLRVFLTLNAFGGTAGWQEFPDAVPVTASGAPVSPKIGGVCPTHFPWRRQRLALLASWLQQFGAGDHGGIDGIWLDFIRYPGHWESSWPEIPDTCYCPRCLELFQVEKGVDIPDGLTTAAAAAWIRTHARSLWLRWKKEQIVSFVREVRAEIDRAGAGLPVRLGAFLVPWSQGERQGAVTFMLGQDAELISRHVDVLSPMVYHKMVGRPAPWPGEMAAYFRDMTGRPVWPIIQAGGTAAAEFGEAVDAVAASGAEGILVYTFSEMQERMWPELARFRPRVNLLPNPRLVVDPQRPRQALTEWNQGRGGAVRDTRFLIQAGTGGESAAVGIAAGLDRQGVLRAALPKCTPGKDYVFSGDFYRDALDNTGYPAVEIWGREYVLNTHRVVGEFQRLRVSVECPGDGGEEDATFAFVNDEAGSTFWLRSPELVEEPVRLPIAGRPDVSGFFPVGAYGATVDNLTQLKEIGLNSAVMPLTTAAIEACVGQDMHCLFSVPRDAEKLLMALDEVGEGLARARFSFYVNDEPEIHGFPRWRARDIASVLDQRYPGVATAMAVVRPQNIPDYADGAQYFMLDQYPVPYMPMTWLADSLDQAAGLVGRNRLQSVIQAFGGPEWSHSGWPRLPTFAEMNCLAFLSVIHGSRGIYFYTFPVVAADPRGRQDLRRLVERLQRMLPWLQQVNQPDPVTVDMLSLNRVDPRGKPAVHCALKNRGKEEMLLCVNTLPTYTRAAVGISGLRDSLWQEFFDDRRAMAVGSTMHLDFEPYEVRALVNRRQL